MLASDRPDRLQVQRHFLIALMGLGILLLSGGAGEMIDPTVIASADTRVQQLEQPDRLDQSLAGANPSLTNVERARILSAIERYSQQYDLDTELVMAVILVESGARPWARSAKGAVGLMQVMPHMMRPLNLAGNLATIESNIEAGCFILAHNIRRLGFEQGISAYFWGTRIRGVAYLNKVLEAQERVRDHRPS